METKKKKKKRITETIAEVTARSAEHGRFFSESKVRERRRDAGVETPRPGAGCRVDACERPPRMASGTREREREREKERQRERERERQGEKERH